MKSINVKNICILFVIISSVVFTTSFILNTSYADEGCDELDLQCRQENWNDSGPEIHKSDTVPESTVDDKTSRSNTDNSFEDWLIALIVIIIIILLGIILVIFRKKHPPSEPEPSRKFFTSERLDSDQEAAVQYRYDKPLIVRAGPGAGKTRVVKERIKDIILEQGVSENKILCFVFF